MHHTLTLEQQSNFLDALLENKIVDNAELSALIEGCKYYEFQVYGNSYFLSRILQSKAAKGIILDTYVPSVYELTVNTNFFIEEITDGFIDFLLRQCSNKDVSIDLDITLIHENYLAQHGR